MLFPFLLAGVPTGVPFRVADNVNSKIYYRFSDFPVVGNKYRCFRYDSFISKEVRLIRADTVVFVDDDYSDMCKDLSVEVFELF